MCSGVLWNASGNVVFSLCFGARVQGLGSRDVVSVPWKKKTRDPRVRRASLGDLGWDFVGQGSFPRGTQADREGDRGGNATHPSGATKRRNVSRGFENPTRVLRPLGALGIVCSLSLPAATRPPAARRVVMAGPLTEYAVSRRRKRE